MPSGVVPRRRGYRSHEQRSPWPEPISEGEQTAATTVGSRGDLVDAESQTVATMLTLEAADLRLRAGILRTDAKHLHQNTYMTEWQTRTQALVQRSSGQLLEELGELGFAWRDVARLVGVSVPAVQKWRRGTPTSPENRLALASLLAAREVMLRHTTIQDFVQWFEITLLQDVPISPVDLWAAGAYPLVFEYALQELTAEEVLDEFKPDWREAYASEWETFVAGDGQLSIRSKDR